MCSSDRASIPISSLPRRTKVASASPPATRPAVAARVTSGPDEGPEQQPAQAQGHQGEQDAGQQPGVVERALEGRHGVGQHHAQGAADGVVVVDADGHVGHQAVAVVDAHHRGPGGQGAVGVAGGFGGMPGQGRAHHLARGHHQDVVEDLVAEAEGEGVVEQEGAHQHRPVGPAEGHRHRLDVLAVAPLQQPAGGLDDGRRAVEERRWCPGRCRSPPAGRARGPCGRGRG